jgi:predicted transcriptional regulator/ribosome-associated translation inhibitor RaiA
MDISSIATPEYAEVDADERLAKAQAIFDRENTKGLIVTDDGDYEGIINEKQLIQSHIQEKAKVRGLIRSAPRVGRQDDVREVARVLVESGAKIAPVYEGDKLWGAITEDQILQAVTENLDTLDVGEICTDDVVTVHDRAHVGEVINLLREHGISRVPVVDDEDRLTGMVTTHDIAAFAIRDMERQQKGDRSGDRDRLLEIPVYDMMNSPVETITSGETVGDAVRSMLENDYAGLVVTPEDNDNDIDGIITKTDVLRALTYTEEDHLDVQITNVKLLDTLTREEIRQEIQAVAEKYQKMNVLHAHVRLHKHKEQMRGTPLMQAQIRLRTNQGQVAGSGEGYGADTSFRVALDKLERRVLELKGVRSDEEYRGQLLRKLGEL